jgi:hypothetical protein
MTKKVNGGDNGSGKGKQDLDFFHKYRKTLLVSSLTKPAYNTNSLFTFANPEDEFSEEEEGEIQTQSMEIQDMEFLKFYLYYKSCSKHWERGEKEWQQKTTAS